LQSITSINLFCEQIFIKVVSYELIAKKAESEMTKIEA
jgi:hypothetical protein